MILKQIKPTGAKKIKILVCAPSNCAVDENLIRSVTGGLAGFSSDPSVLSENLLRVGAPEYKPPDIISQFTLEEKCIVIAIEERIQELNDELQQFETIKAELSKGRLCQVSKTQSEILIKRLPEKSVAFIELDHLSQKEWVLAIVKEIEKEIRDTGSRKKKCQIKGKKKKGIRNYRQLKSHFYYLNDRWCRKTLQLIRLCRIFDH